MRCAWQRDLEMFARGRGRREPGRWGLVAEILCSCQKTTTQMREPNTCCLIGMMFWRNEEAGKRLSERRI